MATTVAIVEPAAAYRRGLEAALVDQAYEPAQSPDDADAVLISLRSEDDCQVITDLAKSKPIVVLVSEGSPSDYAHALSHGARAAARWEDDPAEIVAVLTEAIQGRSRMPVEIATALASEWPGSHVPRPDLDNEEVSWLVGLAAGRTVASIADDAGYSERAMFRRLHDVYTRLGASGRAEAIVAAERFGLLNAT